MYTLQCICLQAHYSRKLQKQCASASMQGPVVKSQFSSNHQHIGMIGVSVVKLSMWCRAQVPDPAGVLTAGIFSAAV
jgi:hypothetical protein